MSKTITATAGRSSELSDDELENVSGGNPLLVGVGLGILFTWGAIAGDCIHAVYNGAPGASIPDGVGAGA